MINNHMKILFLLITLIFICHSDEQLIESISESKLNYRIETKNNTITASSRYKFFEYDNSSLNFIYFYRTKIDGNTLERRNSDGYKLLFQYKF